MESRRLKSLRFARKGANVFIAPYLEITYPDRLELGNNIYISGHMLFFPYRGD